MNTLNNDELSLIKELNSNQIINSTLDITDNSVLFINHESKEKLEKYISEALDKNLQTIVTSENCSISNEKIIKVKNYEEKYNEVLIKLCPGYQGKNFYGITGTNGKTTTGFYLNQLINKPSLFIGTTEEDIFKKVTNEEHLTTPKSVSYTHLTLPTKA